MKATSNPFPIAADHTVVKFDNPGQYAAWIESNATASVKDMVNGSNFYNGETYSTAARKIVTGCKETAARADKLMSKLNATTPATVKRVKRKSPFGRVSVGAYLAADPMPCRVMVKEKTQAAPLTIVVNVICDARTKTADLEARGIAIAALVKRVSKTRPVSLMICASGQADGADKALALVKFPTAPLDSYRLAFMLSNAGFTRGLNFCFYRSIGKISGCKQGSESIGYFNGPDYEDAPESRMKLHLQDFLGTEVFYMPGLTPWSKDGRAAIDNPVKWLNDTCDALK